MAVGANGPAENLLVNHANRDSSPVLARVHKRWIDRFVARNQRPVRPRCNQRVRILGSRSSPLPRVVSALSVIAFVVATNIPLGVVTDQSLG
jgi:hypothetical protein